VIPFPPQPPSPHRFTGIRRSQEMSEHPDVLDGNAATATDVQLINRGAGGERDAIAGL